ncbi:DUF6497 family protein [Jannaschia sp. LMIT008]|uniref:DUF6497 family protein n=1 Tax=Jannaschia maritima TaxID=3032585 RepID=UPI0028123B10|nr:DUF6497 family protein [Jannaschia sp. LMIT008]
MTGPGRIFALCCLLAGPASAETLPSGQAAVLWQILWERGGGDMPQAVLRFIAPGVAGVDPDDVQADLAWLCDTHGVPVAGLPNAPTGGIVVTLMDRPVPRGTTDPQAIQFFGAFTVEEGRCTEDAL